jgi:hypothetical protein
MPDSTSAFPKLCSPYDLILVCWRLARNWLVLSLDPPPGRPGNPTGCAEGPGPLGPGLLSTEGRDACC